MSSRVCGGVGTPGSRKRQSASALRWACEPDCLPQGPIALTCGLDRSWLKDCPRDSIVVRLDGKAQGRTHAPL